MAVKIRDLLKNKEKLVLGKEQVFKLLKLNKLQYIVVASNFHLADELERLAKMSEIEIEVSKHTNKELGALFKKPFSISILGLKK